MQNQLYPSDVIEYSAESYLGTISTRSQAIYVAILGGIILAFLSLPFISMDVVVRTNGIIRPIADKSELKPYVAGTIAAVLVKENQYVRRGQVMLRLQTDGLDTRIRLNQAQQVQKKQHLKDLSRLVALDTTSLLRARKLQSPLYQQQYTQFVQVLSQHQNTLRKKQQELTLTQTLFQEKVVARQEYEDKQFELRSSRSAYLAAMEQQLSQWQADLTTHTFSFTELQAQEKELQQQKELYTIRAPIAGTLQQFTGKYAGSYLQGGEMVGVISPDSGLIAECYVSPKEIGQIRLGMPATFQIDAFNYNEWGLLKGRVTDVAHDVVLLNNQPAFKITCQLDDTYLQLPNGYRGNLKKGMTLQARFSLTQRSLLQLLFDKADDWLNPLQATQ